jgi:hypothetical protein
LLDFTDQIFTVGFAAGGTGMPCRHAYWYLLTAFPLAGLAFWPNYLSQFATSPLEFHMHGITASLWLTLLVFQSWTIQNGQREMHRQTGVLSLGLFPLFLAGGASIFVGMAHRYAAHMPGACRASGSRAKRVAARPE